MTTHPPSETPQGAQTGTSPRLPGTPEECRLIAVNTTLTAKLTEAEAAMAWLTEFAEECVNDPFDRVSPGIQELATQALTKARAILAKCPKTLI
jgi:hypothetical protein